MAKIVIGTSNRGKVREIASILSPLGHDIIPFSMDVDETGKTIEENAVIKALAYSKANPNTYVICEDSGLVVDALDGLPGPYSARFHSAEIGSVDGVLKVLSMPREEFTTDKTEHDRLNNERLVEMIRNVPEQNRTARFEVCFAIAMNGEVIKKVSRESHGFITDEMRGTSGFGYDPVFVGSDTFGKTYAELDPARKNLRSHRKKALTELGLWIAQNIG